MDDPVEDSPPPASPRSMPANRMRGMVRGSLAFMIFNTFFSVVARVFVDPGPIAVGPFVWNRLAVAAVVIAFHGLVIAWIEYRRGAAAP